MARVKGGLVTRRRHKKILKLAKGFRGARSKQFRTANEAVMKSLQNAYIGRKQKKRQFRQLWIARINAAARNNGLSYSVFMNGLKRNNILLNRKVLSELAIHDADAFTTLCNQVKASN